MPWTKIFIDKADFENTLAKEGLRGITYRQAIKEAQEQMLAKDESVFILGEGVDDPGGIFGTTLGFWEKFGKDRVMDIPIAENGLTGIAIGASLAGMKPIFVHMRMDFLLISMDQIINHAAKWHYITGGEVNVPLVIRSIIGRGWGSAAQHTQALHSLFAHIPGLKVVLPATPYDAKGLLIAAVNDGNPIIFIEHRWVYDYIGYVPEEIYEVPIGKGIIIRRGGDITVVAISQMLYETIKAAKILESEGIYLEIIDPRTIKPLDGELILESLKKTGRLIVADVGSKIGGIGAEIIASLLENDPFILKAPPERICLPDVPAPASSVLEKRYYPSCEEIVTAARRLMQVKVAKLREPSIPFDTDIFDISVIIPVLNGEENIYTVINIIIKALEDYNINGEVIVINDAGTDRTEDSVIKMMKKDNRIRMVKHDTPQGIGVSFWDGVDTARGKTIVMLPQHNENDPWEVLRFFNLLEHVDVVIPFVFNRKDRSKVKNILALVYRFVINTTFLVNFNYTNGPLLYRKSILKELNYRSNNFFFQTDILIRIAKKNCLFAQVPYRLRMTKTGISKKVSYPYFLQVIKGYFSLVSDYYFKRKRKSNLFYLR